MSDFLNILGSAWWMIVTLGILVTFHEFGHFWVARRCGVKVLRFSVGFGKPIKSWYGKDGTEYCVAWIPLGGYVKMLDAREGDVESEDLPREFTGKPVWKRILIVLAGPGFNLIFAVAAFWAMLVIGKPDFQPLVGDVTHIAAQAGIQRGDRVLSVNGQAISNWTDLSLALANAAQTRRPTPVQVRTARGAIESHVLQLEKLPPHPSDETLFDQIGMTPLQHTLPAVIGKVDRSSAADAAGLQPGDRVLSIDGTTIADWNQLTETTRKDGAPDRPLALVIERNGRRLAVSLQPRLTAVEGVGKIWAMGVYPKVATAKYDTVVRRGPLAAIPDAFAQTWDFTATTVKMLGHMLSGSAALSNLSGPISIAQYAQTSAEMGPAWFLYFLGIISLSLGIMNLLPIPILDGGHLLYYLIELAKGSPLSERAMAAGQYMGMALLVMLMGLAFYNDILRIFQ
ncbi:MAG: Membrane-associated zinc metalloprotease [Rhodanobacteraceae bacterium]|jgi:regulator of sigma E protease|nr:MAG: Membrane-associated zinc metalloprotease [Rhodanobacteraceae bacterium]